MSATHHTVDPKFTYWDKRAGKDVVRYVGLLDAAHRAGMAMLTSEIQQYPIEENGNTCIVMATVVFRDGDRNRQFSAIGDANPKNVGPAIAPHFIRMAETRAKARALRDALNIGMVTAEELGGAEDDDGHAASQPAPARDSRAAPQPPPTPRAAGGNGPAATLTYEQVLEKAWQMAEDGASYDAIRDFLNLNRHGMTPEGRQLVKVELAKITERFYPPASIAG